MNLLLDTHILLWAARAEPRLSYQALALIENPDNTLFFSVASLWEIVLKNALRRADFYVKNSDLAVGASPPQVRRAFGSLCGLPRLTSP